VAAERRPSAGMLPGPAAPEVSADSPPATERRSVC